MCCITGIISQSLRFLGYERPGLVSTRCRHSLLSRGDDHVLLKSHDQFRYINLSLVQSDIYLRATAHVCLGIAIASLSVVVIIYTFFR
ncbi:hypothetical protein NP493_874g01002 [Ridgeia piscesae]|uniref:Uncharacterized protein n=1 Tax=Ridgeia piscesae TaxID=27915 RepID=A0AAD9KKX2_RIDPI|nr:hypothetical protein NP493_874g01002 [Ridgeia piscesae]